MASTCALDDQGRSKAWCNAWLQWPCRFGTTYRSMSIAIGKGIGRRESRSCRSASWTDHLACHRVPRISTGGTAVVQQELPSSSSCPAAPMPIQNLQNEQMESPMKLGAQERRERKGARPSKTPTSEISGRPVVKGRPASLPVIVSTTEGPGTLVLFAPASSSKHEMTIGGLYVIDGIDVVATLVPEEDVWQFEDNRNPDAGRRAGINCGCGLR